MAKQGQTEQFTARIDSRLLSNIKRLAEREGRSTNEVLNIILRIGFVELAKRKRQSLERLPDQPTATS